MTTDPIEAVSVRGPLSEVVHILGNRAECSGSERLSWLEVLELVNRLQAGDLTFEDVISHLCEMDKREQKSTAVKAELLQILRTDLRQCLGTSVECATNISSSSAAAEIAFQCSEPSSTPMRARSIRARFVTGCLASCKAIAALFTKSSAIKRADNSSFSSTFEYSGSSISTSNTAKTMNGPESPCENKGGGHE